MRSLFFLVIVTYILWGCAIKPYEHIEETWPDGNPKTVKFYTDETRKVVVGEIRYYEDGARKMEGSYKNELRSGQWSYWYSDGQLWSQAVYKMGKENGLRTVWHRNGQKYYEGKSIEDQRKGVWKFWDENGQLIKEIDYDKEPAGLPSE
ncbi:MAG: hypothetical protein FJY07_07470 [Bacteroidetes bacterium]|nr:hypothetical protein [Bacteroidota bacterium]